MGLLKSKKSALLRKDPSENQGYTAVIFVHGLSSNPKATWGNIFKLCENDAGLSRFALDYYSYPTKLWRLPFTTRMASLQELASGLRTEIAERHPNCAEVILVGHSLGGLVIRQYILNEIKAGRSLVAKKALLYAVPNTGASLADVGRALSWNHKHLSQLCSNSDLLNTLNDDWTAFNVENLVEVTYVVGGADAIVSTESARLYKAQNAKTLIGETHRSITKANDNSDLRYVVLRNILLPNSGTTTPITTVGPTRPPNPLFEIYSPTDEPYFIQRTTDDQIFAALTAGHIWLHGASGVGKTAIVSRSAASAGLIVRQVLLASYEDRTAVGLLRALCIELADFAGEEPPTAEVRDLAQLFQSARRSLASLSQAGGVLILVDEFPLAAGQTLSEFLELMVSMTSAISADAKLHGRVVLAFCSIEDPASAVTGTKIGERFNFMKLHVWSPGDLRRLVDLLAAIIRPQLSEAERNAVVQGALGSPRFVKMVFRRWRYGMAGEQDVAQIIQSVKSELV